MFVCCDFCVLSGRGLCDELITRSEESYRLWCVVVCDLETSWKRRPWPIGGAVAPIKKILLLCIMSSYVSVTSLRFSMFEITCRSFATKLVPLILYLAIPTQSSVISVQKVSCPKDIHLEWTYCSCQGTDKSLSRPGRKQATANKL